MVAFEEHESNNVQSRSIDASHEINIVEIKYAIKAAEGGTVRQNDLWWVYTVFRQTGLA